MKACGCWACDRERRQNMSADDWFRNPVLMILCPSCGNKRCPHATDHRLACTDSNAAGQEGSVYQ